MERTEVNEPLNKGTQGFEIIERKGSGTLMDEGG